MISIAAPLVSSRPTVPPSDSSHAPPQAAAFQTRSDIAQPAGPVVADITQPLSEAVLAALSQGAYVAA